MQSFSNSYSLFIFINGKVHSTRSSFYKIQLVYNNVEVNKEGWGCDPSLPEQDDGLRVVFPTS